MSLMKLLRGSVPPALLKTLLSALCVFCLIFGWAVTRESWEDGVLTDTLQTFVMVIKYFAPLAFVYFMEKEMGKIHKSMEAAGGQAKGPVARGVRAEVNETVAQDEPAYTHKVSDEPAAVVATPLDPTLKHHKHAREHAAVQMPAPEVPDVRESGSLAFEPEEHFEHAIHGGYVDMMMSNDDPVSHKPEQMQLFS